MTWVDCTRVGQMWWELPRNRHSLRPLPMKAAKRPLRDGPLHPYPLGLTSVNLRSKWWGVLERRPKRSNSCSACESGWTRQLSTASTAFYKGLFVVLSSPRGNCWTLISVANFIHWNVLSKVWSLKFAIITEMSSLNWEFTMWKFQDFSNTPILCRINFGHFEAPISAI